MTQEAARPSRSGFARAAILISGALVFVLLIGLGVWQVERRAWKLDLIARVDARVHAAPVDAPGPAEWLQVSADRDEYRRVSLTGTFLNDRETRVQAVTDLGPGFWVLTPLRTARGFTVLVNRGFVPPDKRDPATRRDGQIEGETRVTGLLRLTEPKGGFLRANDPAGNRWYSRDVAAIAAARGLEDPAPYFVDADASPNPGGWPAGGLTVVAFRNSHLVYAVTWFGLALMLLGALTYLVREDMRRRRSGSKDDERLASS